MNKEVNLNEFMSFKEVADEIGISTLTLKNWYIWNEITKDKPADAPKLPNFYTMGDNKVARFWRRDDMEKLVKFNNWVPKGRNGVMAEVNRYYFDKEYRAKFIKKRDKNKLENED